MSGKLDQSLDTIMKESRGPRIGNRRRATVKSKTVSGPVGGIAKKSAVKAGKASKKAAAAATPAISAIGESKIVVSGLPSDVGEQQTRDYFNKTIGPIKKVVLTYGPNGQSRGIATITFSKPDSASKAAQELNGVKVDNRPMKIEVLLGAKQAPVVVAKTLSDRIAKPKVGAKGANKATVKAATPAAAAATKGAAAGKGRARGRKPGRVARPKKTTDDLDQEMSDYFGKGGNVNGAVNGAVNGSSAAPAGGEIAMNEAL